MCQNYFTKVKDHESIVKFQNKNVSDQTESNYSEQESE